MKLRQKLERLPDGHWTAGPVTLYGFNAMWWAANIRTPLGYLCFRPPGLSRPWYLYVSPNATPWGAWLIFGGKGDIRAEDHKRARRRREYALSWLVRDNTEQLRAIEESEWLAKGE